jgi:hypothetical protein
MGEDAGTLKFGSAPTTGDTETRILPTARQFPIHKIIDTTIVFDVEATHARYTVASVKKGVPHEENRQCPIRAECFRGYRVG